MTVGEEDVARELALCVREDGLDPAQIAADAGVQLLERSWYLSDPEPIGQPLLGARPGDILGPLPVDGGVLLCFVVERTPPSAADPAVAVRAKARIARRVIEREVARHVRWHQGPG